LFENQKESTEFGDDGVVYLGVTVWLGDVVYFAQWVCSLENRARRVASLKDVVVYFARGEKINLYLGVVGDVVYFARRVCFLENQKTRVASLKGVVGYFARVENCG